MTVQLSPGLDVEVSARLCAALDSNTLALQMQERRRALMANDVRCSEATSISFLGSAAPAVSPADWGPSTGWNWAIQTVTVTPLGSSDVLKLYRGTSGPGMNLANRLKQSFIGSATVDTVTWHPGRTGLVLHGFGSDGLVFAGTLTSGTTYFVNFEIIEVSDAQLPYFLL